MKRIILTTILAACSILNGHAQYKDFKYDSNSDFKLVQIDQYDDATMFFFTVTSKEGRDRFTVNDNTKITIDGAYKTYKLVGTGNIPFTSENCVAYLPKAGDSLNLILQFDKLPLDKPFSMVENPNEKSGHIFNFSNITINTAAQSEKIDVDDFLSFTDYIKSERYNQNGQQYMLYDINGLSVATHLGEEFSGFTRIGKFDIVVTNDSGRPVVLSSDNIKVTAMKSEKKGYEELPLWDVATYDSFVASNNATAVGNYSHDINPIASTISDYRRTRVSSDDLKGQILLGSLEVIARASKQSEVDEYAEALERNRRNLWNNYLQTTSIENGETYGGFVTFKDKQYKKYVVTVTVGGNTYTFYING